MHLAEIGHPGAALDLRRGELRHRGEHRRHGDVDPHVDRAEFSLDLVSRRLDGVGIRHVRGDRERVDAMGGAEVGGGSSQARGLARQKRHVVALPGELLGGRAADAGAGTRDDDDFGHVISFGGS